MRLLRWALLTRLRLRWHGIRLELSASSDTFLADMPTLEVRRGTAGPGVLRIEIRRGVKIGSGVEIAVHTGFTDEIVLRDRVTVSSGVRFKLRGGRIDIGEDAAVRDLVILKSSGDLTTGGRNTLSYGSVIHCRESVTLGRGAGVAEHVSVIDSDHQLGGDDHPWDSEIVSSPIVLGELTSILAGCVVLKGTRTGPGCVAAAGSVLRGEYPPASLIAGSPATAVRSLSARRIGDVVGADPPSAGSNPARTPADGIAGE